MRNLVSPVRAGARVLRLNYYTGDGFLTKQRCSLYPLSVEHCPLINACDVCRRCFPRL